MSWLIRKRRVFQLRCSNNYKLPLLALSQQPYSYRPTNIILSKRSKVAIGNSADEKDHLVNGRKIYSPNKGNSHIVK